MTRLLRIGWLAGFLIGFAFLVSLQFMWLPPGPELEFLRVWLALSGGIIFALGFFLPREPAVWAAPLVCYLVPAAWFRRAEYVDPFAIIVLIAASALSAYVFRKWLSA